MYEIQTATQRIKNANFMCITIFLYEKLAELDEQKPNNV